MANTILIVENEMITAMALEKTLKMKGHTVLAITAEGEEAIALTKQLKPSLVLMDINLKGAITGIEAARCITSELEVPVIFLTAFSYETMAAHINLKSSYGYLTKPVNENDLYIAIDLALLKSRTEKMLVHEAQHLRTEFISNMTHEFHTPLNGIIGFAEIMRKNMNAKPELNKICLENILSTSRTLLRMIDNMLDVHAAEAGKIEFKPAPVDIKQLIAETIAESEAVIAEKKLNISNKISPEIKAVIDPVKFKQVLACYLSNAIKFSKADGHITINVKPKSNHYFRLEVKDNGLGIGQEELTHIFLPFHNLDSSIAKKYPGAGLSLALVRNLVEAQGGYVGVTSTLGKGSTFFAVFPCMPPHDKLEANLKTMVKHVP
jgi:signal transduction histidine kinase